MNGIIVINKDKDFTSFDVVAVVRKLLKVKKVGHTGTLDPNATGVLPVLIGNATKAQDIIPDHDKAYIANFKFGIMTDTLDIWGKVIKEEKTNISANDLQKAMKSFIGEISQIPPMYSSVMVDGVRLYKLAREGKEIDRPSRKRFIYELNLLEFNEETQQGRLYVKCSKGTYVRSLIDDIAKSINSIAVMTDLCRVEACSYTLDDAISLDKLKQLVINNEVESVLLSTESLFKEYDEIIVSEKQAVRFDNGNFLDLDRLDKSIVKENKKIYRVKDKENRFISLGVVDLESNSLKMYKHF